jgi:outer membrane lipoprotein SlyB
MISNPLGALVLATAFVFSPLAATAAEPPTAAEKAAAEARLRAKLARICERCAVVRSTKREARRGDASGAGAVGGAVVGGVVGNKTTDSTVGTVGGAAVGGIIGHQIEKRVKRTKVWVTTVTMKDGSTRKFEAADDPKWSAGTVVEVADGKLKKH